MNERIRVEADLEFAVDGTPARLTSHGYRLVLSSPHPERVWAAVLSAALPVRVGALDRPKAVGRLAAELAAVGLRLEVTGPRGAVAHLGDGVQSRLGRLATGSAAVSPGAPSAVAVLLWSRVPRTTAAAGLALALALAGTAIAYRRRRS